MGRTRSYPGPSTSLPVVLAVLGSATLSAPPASAQATRFWDGDFFDNNWQGPAGTANWTDQTGTINEPWADGGIAVFSGSGLDPSTGDAFVFVDTRFGAVRASGIEVTKGFYRISGDFDPITNESISIELVGAPTSTIRIDDDAQLSVSGLAGNTKLRKTGPGALLLDGGNSYMGGTEIDGGSVVIFGSGDSTLPPSGPVSIDGGTLVADGDSFVKVSAPITLEAGGGTIRAFSLPLTSLAGRFPASAH